MLLNRSPVFVKPSQRIERVVRRLVRVSHCCNLKNSGEREGGSAERWKRRERKSKKNYKPARTLANAQQTHVHSLLCRYQERVNVDGDSGAETYRLHVIRAYRLIAPSFKVPGSIFSNSLLSRYRLSPLRPLNQLGGRFKQSENGIGPSCPPSCCGRRRAVWYRFR